MKRCTTALMAMCIGAAASTVAAQSQRPKVWQHDDGTIVVGDQTFSSWDKYFHSRTFKLLGRKCGLPDNLTGKTSAPNGAGGWLGGGSSSDCTYSSTNPSAAYDPSVVQYRIPVVVHVIRTSDGSQGNLSEACVEKSYYQTTEIETDPLTLHCGKYPRRRP